MKKWIAVSGVLTLALAQAAGRHMPEQKIAVLSQGGQVLVTLSVHNLGAKPVFLPKTVYENHELLGHVFDIKELPGGAEVDYIGPMVKRGPLTRDDFLTLKPGASHSNTIDIGQSYAFKSGKHSYRLSYAGSYLGELAKLDAATDLPLASVSFEHTGK